MFTSWTCKYEVKRHLQKKAYKSLQRVYKGYNSTSLQGKTTMSDDFELGGEYVWGAAEDLNQTSLINTQKTRAYTPINTRTYI